MPAKCKYISFKAKDEEEKIFNQTANYRERQQIAILWLDNRSPRQQSRQPELASSAFRNHGNVCLAIYTKS
jgi:hypothetical protein